MTARLSEITTGQHADMGAAVGGDFSALAAIDQSLARARGYAANTSEAGLFTDAMQSALQVVSGPRTTWPRTSCGRSACRTRSTLTR